MRVKSNEEAHGISCGLSSCEGVAGSSRGGGVDPTQSKGVTVNQGEGRCE